MTVRWSINDEITVLNILPAFDEDGGTSKAATEFDVRTYAPGSRFLLILDVEGAAGNTGGTWSVGESATTGGGVTAATTDGSLAATGSSTANVQRVVSLKPNPAKPFVTVLFTDADASTDAYLTAQLVVLPRTL
jgi:hypothetical protein